MYLGLFKDCTSVGWESVLGHFQYFQGAYQKSELVALTSHFENKVSVFYRDFPWKSTTEGHTILAE